MICYHEIQLFCYYIEIFKFQFFTAPYCKSITIRLMFSDLHGEDVIALTESQLDRLEEAYVEKKGLTIKMSKNVISPQHENTLMVMMDKYIVLKK